MTFVGGFLVLPLKKVVKMGNCGGLLSRASQGNKNHPHGGPPGQQRKNSNDDKRRGSDDSRGKGHGHGHGHGNKKH